MVNAVTNYGLNGSYMQGAGKFISNAYVAHKGDVENIIRFANGQPVTSSYDPSLWDITKGSLPFMGISGGMTAIGTLKNNGWNLSNTIQNVNNASAFKSRSQALSAGLDAVKNKFKDVFKANVVADAPRGFFGRLLDKIPGYKSLRRSGFGQLMSQKGTGAGWMIIMDGVMETFSQVIPAFNQLGSEAGFKQLGKSATKVVLGGVGWVAGDAICRGVGAAIGTAICPGVGTAIGGFIGGFVGGLLGQATAGKIAKSITGKSELELHADKQIADVTEQINASPETKVALAQQALQQAEQVLAQDPTNKDALIAKESAAKILAETQVEQTTQAAEQQMVPQNQPAGYQPAPYMPAIPPVPGFNGFSYDMNVYKQAEQNASMFNPFQYNPMNQSPMNQYLPNPYLNPQPIS